MEYTHALYIYIFVHPVSEILVALLMEPPVQAVDQH